MSDNSQHLLQAIMTESRDQLQAISVPISESITVRVLYNTRTSKRKVLNEQGVN